MRRAILLSVILFCGLVTCVAQEQAQTENKPPDYSSEPFIIEQLKSVARFESDGTGTRRIFARIRVQNEGGVQALGQLVLGYNSANERMSVDAVRVLKTDGTVVTAGPEAVQDLSAPIEREAPVYTDYRQKHITVPGLRPGETLEYEITTEIATPLAEGHFWLDYNFTRRAIVLDEQLEVSYPADRVVKIKTDPDEGLTSFSEEDVATEPGRRAHRWKASFTKREDNENEENQGQPKKKTRRRPRESSDVQLSTFQSWEEVGRWYGRLQRERAAPSDSVRAKAEELTAGLGSNLEKVEGLYGYVARNFRYVSLSFGVGRYQPHSAGDVLANQYGDCKDKHTLLSSLLEAAGLRAWPVLIHSQRELDEEVPSPSQFDHVISAVPLGNELLWMDTTTEVAPFRLLSANLRGKKALVIPADGTPPRLMETPPDPPFPSTQHVEIEGTVTELGRLEAQVRYVLRGDNELPLRMAFRRTPEGRWKDLGQAVASSDGLFGRVSEVKPSDPANTSEPFRLEYRISIGNFLEWSSKQSQLRLPLPGISLPPADADLEAGDDPIELGTPTDVVTRLTLTLPPSYSARAPIPIALKRDYGEYRSQYKVQGQTITAERSMRFLMREVSAERAGDYLAFSHAIDADEAQAINITAAVAGTPAIPETATADELFQAAGPTLRSGNFKLGVELLERLVALEPQHKRAWLALAGAYFALLRYDEAIAAVHKQIEINPYDEIAYNLMGTAYLQQQKYTEATEAFRKQLEIKPLDAVAQANLGIALYRLDRYEEAVNELEKAAVLNPRAAELHVSLGRAYLRLKKPEEALAAFDKAVEISSDTVTFNNIAYELSLNNTHLDRAQQYAESAVAATAAQLRNVSLTRLTREELGRVSSLAAYWDTLGWVHFQRGDLDTAEKYVEASWLLDLHGEVGDHLAQIFEKRGQKEKAIQLYAQALAATRPDAKTRDRLQALVGDQKKLDALVKNAAEEIAILRTVKLGPLVKEPASADFFVLIAPGPTATVEEVKFIRGDEKLRPFGEALRSAQFPALFPDDAPTKLVRRGTLSCSADTGCVFLLLAADNVTSLN